MISIYWWLAPVVVILWSAIAVVRMIPDMPQRTDLDNALLSAAVLYKIRWALIAIGFICGWLTRGWTR